MIEIGNKIRVYDPTKKCIKNAVVTRIADNGIRADQEGYGIVSLRVEISGVWGYEEDRKQIEKIIAAEAK
jgi:hypothetical protein